jgi:hypothetical protein
MKHVDHLWLASNPNDDAVSFSLTPALSRDFA